MGRIGAGGKMIMPKIWIFTPLKKACNVYGLCPNMYVAMIIFLSQHDYIPGKYPVWHDKCHNVWNGVMNINPISVNI